jgi:hypothetical protein
VQAFSDITSDTVWDATGSPYNVDSNFSIDSGKTLTIDGSLGPVEIVFSCHCGIIVNGAIVTTNTSATNTVTFRDTNPTDTNTNQWTEINLQPSALASSFDHVILRNGRNGIANENTTTAITIQNSTFMYEVTGMYSDAQGSITNIYSSTVQDSIYGGYVLNQAAINTQNNIYKRNTYPLAVAPDSLSLSSFGSGGTVDTVGSGSDKNYYDAISMIGASNCPANTCNITAAEMTFAGSQKPYVLLDQHLPLNNDTYNFDQGVVVKGQPNMEIEVQNSATLHINGVSGNPVIFTSIYDDSYLGDTLGDGATTIASNQWRGGIQISSAQAHTVDWAVFRGTRNHGIYAEYGSSGSLVVNDSIFEYSDGGGIDVVDQSGLTTNRNTFRKNTYPIGISPDALASTSLGLGGNVDIVGTGANKNTYDGIELISSSDCPANVCNITVAELTFAGVQKPYLILDQHRGLDFDTFNFAPGVVVKAIPNSEIDVGNSAILHINGVSGNPVVFTSTNDDTYLGDTNGDGGATSIGPGQWRFGIELFSLQAHTIDWAVIRGTRDQSITLNGGPGDSLVINDSVIDNGQGSGIQVYARSALTTRRNTFTKNYFPIGISPDSLAASSLGSGANADIVGTGANKNTYDGLGLISSSDCPANVCNITTAALTFAGAVKPYLITVQHTGLDFDTFNFGPGVVVKVVAGEMDVNNNAVLHINGVAGNPVIFTSEFDDTADGDTNGDGGATVLAEGQFRRGIELFSPQAHTLTYLEIRGAFAEGLRVEFSGGASNLTVDYAVFTKDTTGINFIQVPPHTLTHINIYTNSAWGMYNNTSTVVNAENLWWGNASGPVDTDAGGSCTANAGSGDNVRDTASNPIDYCPFATSAWSMLPPPTVSDLPGSDIDSGYYNKVVVKPDGFPLIYYYNLTGNADTATMIGCSNADCTAYSTTSIDTVTKPVGAWGLLYFKSDGKPTYISRNVTLQGTLSRLDCNDANCITSSFAGSVFTDTGGYYGPVGGAVRPNGVPFFAIDGINGMSGILDSFTCSTENCTSGTRRTLLSGLSSGSTNPSTAVLSDNRPLVSYYDPASQSLRLYVCANVSCSSGSAHTLDSGTGAFGQVSQIIIRNDDTAGIAYSSPSGLKFYSCDDADCTTGTAYSVHDEDGGTMTGNYGGGSMVQLDTDGNPVILNTQARRRSPAVSLYECYNPNCSEGRFRTFYQNGESVGIYGSLLIRDDGGYVIPFKNNTTRKTTLYDQISTDSSMIGSLTGSLEAKQVSRVDPLSVLTTSNSDPQTQNFSTAVVDLRIQNTSDIPIADVTVTFNTDGDLDWSSVTGDTDGTLGKAVIGNLETAPGTDSSHALYIPKLSGHGAVRICPGATTLAQVTATCSGGYNLTTGDNNVNVVTIGGNDYWKVTGLTGTGGLSLLGTTGIKDTLTRLQVSTVSDHTIQFSSINGVTASGQTIAIQFDPGTFNWDLTAITLGDIDLLIADTSITLASSPGVSTWGVNINTSTDTITFTAPTSGSGYLTAGAQALVLIGLNASGGSNQIVNPATVSAYEVHIVITNAGIETAEIEIPIIDDDTVNVTGYIDTFISFDIDTASSNIDCDASGGTNPCDSYGGATDNSGYLVDLGEMTTSTVNSSGVTVLHSDNNSGSINSVFLDFSSNADGGVGVKLYSLNNALLGPGGSNITSVGSGEVQIIAGSSLYGVQNRTGDIRYATSGTITVDPDCAGNNGDDYFCSVGSTAGRTLLTTDGSVDTGRVQLRVGASPNSLNSTGTYTDQLTFIATATF